jgi:glutamate carboxypeptidase
MVAAVLRRERDEMLNAIAHLVAIDSGSGTVVGVDAVSGWTARFLADVGFTVGRRAVPEVGDQVTVTRRSADGPRVLVVGHADTVWPAGTAEMRPFARDGGEISGPGVGDMKASLVMACHALRALAAAGMLERRSVTVLVVPDEELGSPHSRTWIEDEAAGADACLGLEAASPGGGVVVARGAVGAVTVRARGRAEHVTEAEGEPGSAVSALAPLVARLEGLSDRRSGLAVSVGRFSGGEARQVVPGAAEMAVDLRAPSRVTAAELLARVRSEIESARRPPGVEIEIEGGFTRPPFEQTRAGRDLYALAEAACGELGVGIHPRSERGGSDASFPAAQGVPTLDGLGPVCRDPCSPRERVDVASIAERGAVFAAVVARTPAHG